MSDVLSAGELDKAELDRLDRKIDEDCWWTAAEALRVLTAYRAQEARLAELSFVVGRLSSGAELQSVMAINNDLAAQLAARSAQVERLKLILRGCPFSGPVSSDGGCPVCHSGKDDLCRFNDARRDALTEPAVSKGAA